MEKVIVFDSRALDLEDEDAVQISWDDFFESISDKTNPVIITGYFMAWDGKKEGHMVRKNLYQAVRDILMDDSSPIFSFDESDNFVLDETHHDAPVSGNHYVFHVLTDAGVKWYEENKNSCTPREIGETLVKPEYSRKVEHNEVGL
ncbi:MAG: hypothetical protein KBT06_04425 [Prevotellaceae bacterium]|nr:hypothetical protein [Candidatus Colivivens equi]